MRYQKKVEMPAYTKEGFHSTHPVTRNQKDNKIRGEGDVGDFRHSMTRSGSPATGYMAESLAENKRPARDGKIAGMPPIQHNVYGKPENGRGAGAMRNTQDCYNMSPRYGKEVPSYKPTRHSGER